jgi:DNA polymerase V
MQSNQSHGGKRVGAGRKPGSGRKWREATQAIRLPASVCESLQNKLNEAKRQAPMDAYLPALNPVVLQLPLYLSKVPAGFPVVADDYVEKLIDLNQLLIQDVNDSFMTWVTGLSMIGVNIFDGDLVLVERSIPPKSGDIVVATLQGEVTVKTLRIEDGQPWLCPENPDFKAIKITAESECRIWGVVTNVIHSLLRTRPKRAA